MSLSWDVGSISAVSRARSLMSAGSFSRTAAGNRAYEMQSFVLLKVNPYMLSILIFLFFWFCFVSKCFIFDGELLEGSKNLCLVVCQKITFEKMNQKFNFFSVVLHILRLSKKYSNWLFLKCLYRNTYLSLWLRMIYARERSIYASWSLVKGLNHANELAVCCVNIIGL